MRYNAQYVWYYFLHKDECITRYFHICMSVPLKKTYGKATRCSSKIKTWKKDSLSTVIDRSTTAYYRVRNRRGRIERGANIRRGQQNN